MKHLRRDYDHIQPIRHHVDPAVFDGDLRYKEIPDDEPVFVLRAKDPLAAGAVMAWVTYQKQHGAAPELIQAVTQWALHMRRYNLEHYPTHVHPHADVPEGMLRPQEEW